MDTSSINGSVMSHVATALLEAVGVAGIPPSVQMRNGDFLSIIGSPMPNPLDFNSPDGFAKAYLAYNLTRKFSSYPVDIDRPRAAFDAFCASEKHCEAINDRGFVFAFDVGVPLRRQTQSLFERAREIIKRSLGPFKYDEFERSCDFSNGASTRCSRKASTPFDKLSGRPHVTLNCRDLAVHYVWCNQLWRNQCHSAFGRESDPYSWFTTVSGSRFTTVPKDSKTDRPICVEPDLNMFFQKGIGAMIRRRLRFAGVDLNDQTVNQRLARVGSIENTLATIDLSSASDSVSLSLVEEILPRDWVRMILLTRSEYVTLPTGKVKRLEKVSSMGNGYTFELESLIFWALSRACAEVFSSSEPLSVYGDDIIVDVKAVPLLLKLLTATGFSVNVNKSFWDGPFRESCGKHYFNGSDVTPFYIRDHIETDADCYHLANQIAEWGWLDPDVVSRITALLLKGIPPSRRCYVPPSFGSRQGLRCVTPRGRWSRKHQQWRFRYLRDVRSEHDLNGPIAYLTAMLLGEQRGPSEFSKKPVGVTRTIVSYGRTSQC